MYGTILTWRVRGRLIAKVSGVSMSALERLGRNLLTHRRWRHWLPKQSAAKDHAVLLWNPGGDPTMIDAWSAGEAWPPSVRKAKGGLHAKEISKRAGCGCGDRAIAGQRFCAWRIWRWLARRRLGRWRLARRWLGLARSGLWSFGRRPWHGQGAGWGGPGWGGPGWGYASWEGGCTRWRRVWTGWGWRLVPVNVCW